MQTQVVSKYANLSWPSKQCCCCSRRCLENLEITGNECPNEVFPPAIYELTGLTCLALNNCNLGELLQDFSKLTRLNSFSAMCACTPHPHFSCHIGHTCFPPHQAAASPQTTPSYPTMQASQRIGEVAENSIQNEMQFLLAECIASISVPGNCMHAKPTFL